MKKCVTAVGLDVHENSIDIALADSDRDNEVRHYGAIGGDLAALDTVVRKPVSKGERSPLCLRKANGSSIQ